MTPAIAIVYVGVLAEAALPWAAIWLSDTLHFDIPAWSLWPIFGTAPALCLCALATHWTKRHRARQRPHGV